MISNLSPYYYFLKLSDKEIRVLLPVHFIDGSKSRLDNDRDFGQMTLLTQDSQRISIGREGLYFVLSGRAKESH